MKTDSIRVLNCEVKKPPVAIVIQNTPSAFRKLVQGQIGSAEVAENLVLMVNDDGKLDGLPLNRALVDDGGRIYDIVAGHCFLVRVVGSGVVSLTDSDVAEWAGRLPCVSAVDVAGVIAENARMRTSAIPHHLDLRRFDAAACDQLYPGAVVAMTPKLAKKWGPTEEESVRAWDIMFMSRNAPDKQRTRDGHLFRLCVCDERGRSVEVKLRAHVFGWDWITDVVFSLPNEDVVDIPGLNIKGAPNFMGSVRGGW